MEYFIYISDTKLDMLLSQISPEQKGRIESDLKIDFKLFGAARKTVVDNEKNRHVKLEVVASFIRDFGNLGTVDAPDEYIEDSLEVRWGPFKGASSPVVYFGGMTSETIVGLGGSVHHVLGNKGQGNAFSGSVTPFLLAYLEEHLDIPSDQGALPESSDMSLRAVHLATSSMKGPKQRIRFMAKKLLYGPSPYPDRDSRSDMSVLLATPIYVALEE
ncbi:MAG: SAVMC3_10250 family protein [Pyrinomonadaceae bacterium]